MQEDKHKPNMTALYEELAENISRMNNQPNDEDIINFETNLGVILKLFPGSHYKCEMEEDSYNEIEDIVFYYDDDEGPDIISTISPTIC